MYQSIANQLLFLDVDILIWVLLPITIVMFTSGFIITYLSPSQLSHHPLFQPHSRQLSIHRSALLQVHSLQNHGNYLHPLIFQAYNSYLLQNSSYGVHSDAATLREKLLDGEQAGEVDPSAITSGMLHQVLNSIPSVVQFSWVSYFFNHIIVAKLAAQPPDNLSVMFHHAISHLNLSPSYISSVSWYILNLFGLSSLHTSLAAQDASDLIPMLGGRDLGSHIMAVQNFQPSQPNGDSLFGSSSPDFSSEYARARNQLQLQSWSSHYFNFGEEYLLKNKIE